MHNDNDDDGETAAGSRLAHLLQILVQFLVLGFPNESPSNELDLFGLPGIRSCSGGSNEVFRRRPSGPGSVRVVFTLPTFLHSICLG